MRRKAKRPLLVGTVILVFLSIFTKSQASSPFEAMNSAHLSMCQKDVRPSVQKSGGVSTGDSVNPSSCEMKYEPAFRLEMGVSGNLWIVVKDVKTLVVYDVQ